MDSPDLTDLIRKQEEELKKQQELQRQIDAQRAAQDALYDNAVTREFDRFQEITWETIVKNNNSLTPEQSFARLNVRDKPMAKWITFKDRFVQYQLVRISHQSPFGSSWPSPWIPSRKEDLGMQGDLGLEVHFGYQDGLKPRGRLQGLAVWACVSGDHTIGWQAFFFAPCSLTQPSWDGKNTCSTCKRFQERHWSTESLSRWLLEALVNPQLEESRAPGFYPDHSVQGCRQSELSSQRGDA